MDLVENNFTLFFSENKHHHNIKGEVHSGHLDHYHFLVFHILSHPSKSVLYFQISECSFHYSKRIWWLPILYNKFQIPQANIHEPLPSLPNYPRGTASTEGSRCSFFPECASAIPILVISSIVLFPTYNVPLLLSTYAESTSMLTPSLSYA